MRKLFNELFYIPEQGTGKMREKAFLVRITVSVFAIIFCLSAMGLIAYAWFSGSVISNTNTIVAANYDLDWKITIADNIGASQTSVNTDIVIAQDTDAPKEYAIHIEKSKTSMATTGFCVIKVDFNNDGTTDKIYHTVQIGKDVEDTSLSNGERLSLDFTIKLNQAAKITFTPYWGTSCYYSDFNTISVDDDGNDNYITDGETVEIGTLQYTDETNDQPQQTDGTMTSDTDESGGTSSKETETSETTETETSENTVSSETRSETADTNETTAITA